VPNVKKSGALTYPDPLGPSRRPVVGETFTFTLILPAARLYFCHACHLTSLFTYLPDYVRIFVLEILATYYET